MVFFMFSDLRQEMIVHVVDIGGIVDHHSLNFLFIIGIFKVRCTIFTVLGNDGDRRHTSVMETGDTGL